jgi:thioredoxin-related protein
MLKKLFLLFILCTFSISVILSQSNEKKEEKPKEAKIILNASLKEAKSSGKTVFLIFHASWCSWCKRLDKVIESTELNKIFTDNFIITHLDVLERGNKIQELENPGGNEMMKKYGGAKSGLPFYVFLAGNGKKLADSNVMPKSQNIGYPGAADEIDAFIKLLKKSSKKITEKELKTISEYLTVNAPK